MVRRHLPGRRGPGRQQGANLGELATAGLPVPAGFVVTADAYFHALDEAGVRRKLPARVDGLDVDDTEALAAAARDCQVTVRGAGVPAHPRRHRPRALRG